MHSSERLDILLGLDPEQGNNYIEGNFAEFIDNNELIGINTYKGLSRMYYSKRDKSSFTRLIFVYDNDNWVQESKVVR